jgi:hypothetical protein
MSDPKPSAFASFRRAANPRFWGPLGRVLAGLAAFAAILGFAIEQMSGGSAASECQNQSLAALGKPTIMETTLGDFRERFSSPEAGDTSAGLTPKQLATRVTYVELDVSVDGQMGKPVTLRWSMEDAKRPQAGGLPQNLNAVTITPPSCSHRHVEHVLLDPAVPSGRAVVVKLFLQDEEGNQLGRERRTPAIRAVATRA